MIDDKLNSIIYIWIAILNNFSIIRKVPKKK